MVIDIELVRSVAGAVNVPLIAHGGASTVEDITAAIRLGGASAVAVGSMVVFQRQGMGVLVNFPSPEAGPAPRSPRPPPKALDGGCRAPSERPHATNLHRTERGRWVFLERGGWHAGQRSRRSILQSLTERPRIWTGRRRSSRRRLLALRHAPPGSLRNRLWVASLCNVNRLRSGRIRAAALFPWAAYHFDGFILGGHETFLGGPDLWDPPPPWEAGGHRVPQARITALHTSAGPASASLGAADRSRTKHDASVDASLEQSATPPLWSPCLHQHNCT